MGHTALVQCGRRSGTEKSKVTVNTIGLSKVDIQMNGIQLAEVESFRYLGATLIKD